MKTKIEACKDCGHIGRLIAGRCKRHYWAYRKSLKPKRAILKPFKKIKTSSGKRTLDNRIYVRERANFLLKNEYCQCGLPGCTRKATEIHHKRGRIGKLLYDTRYFLSVCRNCHNCIEMNPLWAQQNDFSQSRLRK